jgi:malonyl CoA-acyl carrier protein transacylase
MRAFVFPGQGSQRCGMGSELFESALYKSMEDEVDKILGYSLKRLCLVDPEKRLKQTEYTQPSVYVVNALTYFERIARGQRPDYVAGHSLGEYNALLAAGAFDFLTGLRLVQRRGAFMSQVKGGGMAAVCGITPEKIEALFRQHQLTALDIANYNSPSQVVISGQVDDIQRAGPLFQRAGASLYMPLWVSASFHSRYMASVAAEYEKFLNSFEFKSLSTPVISNVTGRPYPKEDPNTAIRTLLVRQIDHPVQWTQGVQYLLDVGVTTFEEIGPGNVLSKTIQEIQVAGKAVRMA